VRHGVETLVQDWRSAAGLDLLPFLVKRAGGVALAELLRSGMEMRAAIAPDIARLAAMRARGHIADGLDHVVEEMERAEDDLLLLQSLSLQFWALLTAGCDNPAYQLAFNSLRDAILSLREPVAAAMEFQLRDLSGFRAIAHAVRARDAKKAASATRAHIAIAPRFKKKK
jgi:GntR family transcriptional regulator, transcriptional repressor for pyruvate dehydrogenase complex